MGVAMMTITTGSAAGQTTEWFDTGGGQIRLVIAPPQPGDETLKGVIDIALAEGWHTYWRDPGSSGIPPQIDVSGSTGLMNPVIAYPAPKWIENDYGDYAGYAKPVRLPFTLTRTATAPHRLVANVFLGICEDICIPVQTRFETMIGYATGSTLDAMIANSAHEDLPAEPIAGFGLVETGPPSAGHAILSVDHASMPDQSPQLFVHAPDGTQFYPPNMIASQGGQTIFEIMPVKSSPDARSIQTIITVTADDRAFTTPHTLYVAGDDDAPASGD